MDLDDLLRRYFGTANLIEASPAMRESGIDRLRVDFGLVPANLTTVDGLLKAYFEPAAPFEASGDKKSEFPDAIALMSLEEWARSSGRTILAASADKGWKAFADRSDDIFIQGDLGGALQIVQDDTDTAATAVNRLLRGMTDGELYELMASISDSLSDALIDRLGFRDRGVIVPKVRGRHIRTCVRAVQLRQAGGRVCREDRPAGSRGDGRPSRGRDYSDSHGRLLALRLGRH
jgi:hypothetical protein